MSPLALSRSPVSQASLKSYPDMLVVQVEVRVRVEWGEVAAGFGTFWPTQQFRPRGGARSTTE